MIAAIDVDYDKQRYNAVAALFTSWTTAHPTKGIWSLQSKGVYEYQAGAFYLRELVPILSLLDEMSNLPKTIVIDAYCQLSEAGDPGLGVHLYQALDEKIPIIGVAKTRYKATTHAIEIFRGKSKRPLFVTAIGCEIAQAAKNIISMHGTNRIPTIIKLVDTMSKRWEAESGTLRTVTSLVSGA